ncbi:MAG TPA: hypothetical protein VN044_03615 [Verrucomicrobiae bacterium]|jgi:hypothetical protein|nr:hypothetical protein [Verrucomicrobiae bacterium]
MNSSDSVRPQLDRLQKQALLGGLACLVVSLSLGVIGGRSGVMGWQQFFRSYLFAYVYWILIPLGSIAILMLHNLTGGWWGLPIRRILEACSRTVPLMAALFIPIWIGRSQLYSWARPADVESDPILQQKRWFLNPTGFTVRVIVYFAIWLAIVYLLNKWSREQDRTADPSLADRMVALSGPGLILWGLLVTAAAVDWVMSLEPHWFSTIYGMIFIVIECLAALSFAVFVLRMISNHEPIKDSVEPKQFHDLGNLMLAFVLLWAYLSFDQLLIMWSGNLKDEIPWYMQRAFGGWAPVGVVLIVLHFFIPFFLLLQRGVKRRLRRLSVVAGLLIVLTLVDIYWIVVPSYETLAPRVHLLDIFAVLGIGGLWLSTFAWQLKQMPLLPLHDPRFEALLEHEHGD